MTCDIKLQTIIKHAEDLDLMRQKLLDIDNYKPIDYQLSKQGDYHEVIQNNEFMRNLVKDYSKDEYKFLNNMYRELFKDKTLRKDNYKLTNVNALSDLFRYQGDYLGTTYRGTRLSDKVLNTLKPGDILINPTPMSTSKDVIEAETWAKSGVLTENRNARTILEIDNNVLPQYNISQYSYHPHEQEILMEPNLPLKVLDISKADDGIIEVHLEVDKDYINNPAGTKHAVYNALGILLGIGLGSQMNEAK
jgi:hypothetical protein